jgi:hypothetical protein
MRTLPWGVHLFVHFHRVELKVGIRKRARVVVDEVYVWAESKVFPRCTQRSIIHTFASPGATRGTVDSAGPVSTCTYVQQKNRER